MGDTDFTEKVKEEVKRKAAFRCCRCQNIGIQVHHILPQEYGGSNDIDNAAPLCPSCHVYFGGNPDTRKEIRLMRDWWYEQVPKQFPDNRLYPQFEVLNTKVDELQQNQMSLDDFKHVLTAFAIEMINNTTMGTAVIVASGIASASASAESFSSSSSASSSPSPSPEIPEEEQID